MRCGRKECARLFKRYESIAVFSDAKAKIERGMEAARAQLANETEPLMRGVIERRIEAQDGSIPWPCPACGHLYSRRHFTPDSVPVVHKMQGTWPEESPDALRGKHFMSKSERDEQIRVLAPDCESRDNLPKRIKGHGVQTFSGEVAGAIAGDDAAPVPIAADDVDTVIRNWFLRHPKPWNVKEIVYGTGVSPVAVRQVLDGPGYKRVMGQRFELVEHAEASAAG